MPWIYHIQGARGAYELCFKESEPADWSDYILTLTENGFSLVQQSTNTDASFAVLKKDGVEVTVDYWSATKELAVLIDKPDYEKPMIAESVAAVTTPKVIEPGLEYAGASKECAILFKHRTEASSSLTAATATRSSSTEFIRS